VMKPILPLAGVVLLSACAGTPSPAPPSADAGILLRVAPPVGQVSHYRVVSETSIDMEGMPMMGSGVSMSQTMFLTNTVLEETGELLTISTVIDSVDVDAPGMMGMVGQTLERIEGASMETVMSTRGDYQRAKVDESTVPSDMVSAFGVMQESFGGLSLGLPEEAVGPGATWTVPVTKTVSTPGMGEMVQGGEMSFVFERTEEGEDGRHAILSFTGVHTQGLGGDPSAQVTMEMDMSGESSGEVDLSLSEGRIHGMTMTMNMGGVMFMMGNEITMSSTVTMTHTLLGQGDE